MQTKALIFLVRAREFSRKFRAKSEFKEAGVELYTEVGSSAAAAVCMIIIQIAQRYFVSIICLYIPSF